MEYKFADACRKLMVFYDDAENENEVAVDPLSSPVPLPKVRVYVFGFPDIFLISVFPLLSARSS